jgi:CRP/FNR family transcriptional regulator, cyclic AMP receptor protein
MSSTTYEGFDQLSQLTKGESCSLSSVDPDVPNQLDNFRPEFAGPPTYQVPHRVHTRQLVRHWTASNSVHTHEYSGVDPLDLFHLASRWHLEKEPSAGWELVALLRSSDCDTRASAAELLARTEYGRVLKRDLRRAKARLRRETAARRESESFHCEASRVSGPYGMEVVDNCAACKLRKHGWFCSLSPDGLRSVGEASHITTYPCGAVLFVEGQEPRGVYVLCSGKAKLSTTSREGKVLILRIAEPGEVLGLSAGISGQPFEVTAETTEPCQVNFIEREALIERIERSGELGLHSSVALSQEFQCAYRDIHDLILARSSVGKLARLLLSWMPHLPHPSQSGEVRVRATLTHEEMAQMIGSSRETVTRLIGDLKKRELIRLDGSTLVIRDRVALEALAS